MVGSELGPLDPLGPEPELPDPEPELPDPEAELPDPEPELSSPELPEPELPEPELPEPELPEPELPEPELPEPELPEPELPDPELPDPELPDPELPDPELPDPELPEWPWPEPGPLESVSSSPLRRLSSPSPGPLRSSPPPPLGSRWLPRSPAEPSPPRPLAAETSRPAVGGAATNGLALASRCGSLGGFGTTATPLTTALVTRAPAHTFATAAPAAPAPPSSATRVATGSVPTPHGIRPKRAGGVIDVRPARTAWRARLSNWRTAPPVAPSSAAISS